jgi:hypothetical protein
VIANKFHDEVEAAGTSMLVAAWNAGQTLLTAKELGEHGEWLPWLEADFHGTRRTAQRYMTLASNTTCVSDLDTAQSINAALEAIRTNNQSEAPSYKPKPKRGKATSSSQKFEKRYNTLSDDISFIVYTAEKDAEFAGAAFENLDRLVEQRDLLTKEIRKLRVQFTTQKRRKK